MSLADKFLKRMTGRTLSEIASMMQESLRSIQRKSGWHKCYKCGQYFVLQSELNSHRIDCKARKK
jgi:hypothetical protein